MKRFFALLLAASTLISAMAGCAKDNNSSSSGSSQGSSSQSSSSSSSSSAAAGTLKEGETLEGIVEKVQQEFGDWYVQMSSELDDTTLKDMFHIEPEWVDEYAGHFTMTMTSTDNFVVIKATDGHVSDVEAALEQRRADLEQQFAQYLPGPYEKVKAGKVITKGNYVFLVVLGDPEAGVEKELARAEKIIDDAFNA